MLGFLGPIANLANTFVEGRVAKSKAKAKVQVAKANAEAEVMKVAATHEAGWEKIMAEASADSWKDEAWTILFIVIIALLLTSLKTLYTTLTPSALHADNVCCPS